MGQNKKKEKKMKSLSDIDKKISKLLEQTPDISPEDEAVIKDEIKRILFHQKNYLNLIIRLISSMLKQLVLRYIILVLIISLFFNYIILENKYYIFLLALGVAIIMTILSMIITSHSVFRFKNAIKNMLIGLVLTVCIALLVNSYFPIFSSNIALSVYLVLSSVVYNIINYWLISSRITKGI